jgi:hypothetical protein
MAGYKVSYKVLKQQGESMKNIAKVVDGYAEQLLKVKNKLGSDDLLSQVRNNLQKLYSQLLEARAILKLAGEVLVKTVEQYGGAERRQVKKVDGTKAHNRDFYKRPVVVPSVGGDVVGVVVSTTTTATVNYADQPTSVNTGDPAITDPISDTGPSFSQSDPSQDGAIQPLTADASGGGSGLAPEMLSGALGGVAAAIGGLKVKEHLDAKKQEAEQGSEDQYDPDAELGKTIQRVRDLEQEALNDVSGNASAPNTAPATDGD